MQPTAVSGVGAGSASARFKHLQSATFNLYGGAVGLDTVRGLVRLPTPGSGGQARPEAATNTLHRALFHPLQVSGSACVVSLEEVFLLGLICTIQMFYVTKMQHIA